MLNSEGDLGRIRWSGMLDTEGDLDRNRSRLGFPASEGGESDRWLALESEPHAAGSMMVPWDPLS